MNSNERIVRHILLSVVVIAACVMAVGYLFYRGAIFVSDLVPVQFIYSGSTAAIAYAVGKHSTRRNMWMALFVYYVLLTGFIWNYNTWIPILQLAYVAGIAGAILLYEVARRKLPLNNAILRIIFAGAIISLANGVIVIALTLFSPRLFVFDTGLIWSVIFKNMEYGALIGLGAGIGIELADWLDAKLITYETAAQPQS